MQVTLTSIYVFSFMKKLWLKYAYIHVFCNLCLGHYVPQLAELMLQFNKKEKLFNLKGIAVSYSTNF